MITAARLHGANASAAAGSADYASLCRRLAATPADRGVIALFAGRWPSLTNLAERVEGGVICTLAMRGVGDGGWRGQETELREAFPSAGALRYLSPVYVDGLCVECQGRGHRLEAAGNGAAPARSRCVTCAGTGYVPDPAQLRHTLLTLLRRIYQGPSTLEPRRQVSPGEWLKELAIASSGAGAADDAALLADQRARLAQRLSGCLLAFGATVEEGAGDGRGGGALRVQPYSVLSDAGFDLRPLVFWVPPTLRVRMPPSRASAVPRGQRVTLVARAILHEDGGPLLSGESEQFLLGIRLRPGGPVVAVLGSRDYWCRLGTGIVTDPY